MPTESAAHEWMIRPFADGDEDALCALFERAFGRRIARQEWMWKHHTLSSPAPNVWLAVHGAQPIFHTAGIPLRYKLNGREQIAMVSVDTMTDPAWRRRGLLTDVGRIAYDAYRVAQIPFVIGILNDKWGSRANALGWTPLFPLAWQVRPLLPTGILARRAQISMLTRASFFDALWNQFWNLRMRADKKIRVRALERAGDELDVLWRAAASDYCFTIVRDRAWVEWRYLQEPTQKYRVLFAHDERMPRGYLAHRLVEKQGRRAGIVAEIFTRRGDTAAVYALLAQLLSEWQTQKIQLAMHCAARRTWLHTTLRRVGFIFSPGAFSAQMIPLDTQLPMAALRDPQNWFMAGSDYDDV